MLIIKLFIERTLRKDRISIALTKEIIAKVDEASLKARRSRSEYIQIILEEHFKSSGEIEKAPAPALRSAI